ncbi:Retrovirus-related Pol polyprotein from transposon TNT 1-94 [Senna tora]|uniref:Retrovirus-related Pol polyprotein from transposon TNT 1-94 n=1 Tax=Senna tora TaxID=362788 RepID=A0A834TZK5_9FABA|nr:Retrovirus-related Pol polyprotein from transposon TNT 1-94 [Senna tora]
MATKYEVEKFDGGSKFSMWKIRMLSVLILQDLWQAIEDKFAVSVTKEQRLVIKKKVLGAIFMSVTNSVLREIAGEDTAAKVWKKLEELLGESGHVKKYCLGGASSAKGSEVDAGIASLVMEEMCGGVMSMAKGLPGKANIWK